MLYEVITEQSPLAAQLDEAAHRAPLADACLRARHDRVPAPEQPQGAGLHQALEAKEGVKIEKENQTLASITFQNYFRMYNKLAGMTGTADTERNNFV